MMSQAPGGLSALLNGMIDYAGLFPPASLSLQEALSVYLQDVRGKDAWMLSGFVLPTGRMEAAAQILDEAADTGELVFSALGRGGDDREAFLDGLDSDIELIETFRAHMGARVSVPVLETRLPGNELDFQIRADALVRQAAGRAAAAGLLPYFEVPFDGDWEARAARAILSIRDAGSPARFKIRTGGVVPEAFPSPRRLAWGLLEAANAGVAYKCTAGLHHPIRRFDPETGAMMHGFINVFAGAILAAVHGLDLDRLERILAEEDPAAFHFGDEGLAWQELRATTADIRQARSGQVISVGSCSFDEPRQDLQALGWLG